MSAVLGSCLYPLWETQASQKERKKTNMDFLNSVAKWSSPQKLSNITPVVIATAGELMEGNEFFFLTT